LRKAEGWIHIEKKKTRRIKDTDFAFAVAKVRAWERGLLDGAKIERLIDAGDLDEFTKILADFGIEGGNLDSALKNGLEKTYSEVKEILPEENLLNIFFVKTDYHNLRVLIKSECGAALDGGGNPALLGGGNILAERLKNAFRDRRLGDLCPFMKEAAGECLESYSKFKDPQAIDLILDKAELEARFRVADVSDFTRKITNLQREFYNARVFLRIKKSGGGLEKLKKLLIKTPDYAKYSAAFGADEPDFSDEIINAAVKTNSPGQMERIFDNHILKLVNESKKGAFGIEPVISYVYLKENDIKNIKIIAVSKAAGASAAEIKGRLRTAWPIKSE
jgi:V/A-type H+-transporting ATPase subunit C